MNRLMDSCRLLQVVTVIIIYLLEPGIESTRFILQNNCPYTIWPAALTSANSPPLPTTGFTLLQGLSSTINVPPGWAGRFWARTLCATNSSGGFLCFVGDCGSGNLSCAAGPSDTQPPPTLVEFSLNGAGNTDFYDVSLVDGFNVPVTITPRDGACKSAACPKDINSVCPWPMAIKDPSDNTSVVACKSACAVFNTEAYCCTGSYSNPKKCYQSDYAAVFKSQCPEAYSYTFDDASSTFSCPSGGDYFISFCNASAQPQYIGMLCIA